MNWDVHIAPELKMPKCIDYINHIMIVNGIEVINTKHKSKSLHDKDFNDWVKREKIKTFDNLSDVMSNCKVDLRKGQKCAVINGYNLLLHGYTIMGFAKPDEYGDCVYLNWDCYWHSVKPEKIVLE